MSYYAVFGDIHPSMMVRVDEAEAKTIQTKLAIGVPVILEQRISFS